MIVKAGCSFVTKEDVCNGCPKNAQGCALQYFLKMHNADMNITINECKEAKSEY